MLNPYSLEGKSILVTGATSGIGKATAIVCAKLGAKIIISGRNENRLNETLDELTSISNLGHKGIKADLNTSEGIELLVANCPKLDGISSNAGIVNTKLIKFLKEEEYNAIFDTNAKSHVFLIQKLFKKKTINNNASIVLTASIGGTISHVPGLAAYGMSKAAINSFMKFVAIEFAGKGIRCNSVCPAMIDTPMTQALDALTEENHEKDKASYLLKRYGKPEEVAYAIAFLLSNASSFITGQSIIIDGGYDCNH